MELRGCNIKYSDSDKGFGIFAADEVSDGNPTLPLKHKFVNFCSLRTCESGQAIGFQYQLLQSLRTM